MNQHSRATDIFFLDRRSCVGGTGGLRVAASASSTGPRRGSHLRWSRSSLRSAALNHHPRLLSSLISPPLYSSARWTTSTTSPGRPRPPPPHLPLSAGPRISPPRPPQQAVAAPVPPRTFPLSIGSPTSSTRTAPTRPPSPHRRRRDRRPRLLVPRRRLPPADRSRPTRLAACSRLGPPPPPRPRGRSRS